jgi:hypothetical protein
MRPSVVSSVFLRPGQILDPAMPPIAAAAAAAPGAAVEAQVEPAQREEQQLQHDERGQDY